MTVFLDDSVAIAGCPKIIFIVNGAAVSDVGNGFPIAKAIHYIAVGIEFKEGGACCAISPSLSVISLRLTMKM